MILVPSYILETILFSTSCPCGLPLLTPPALCDGVFLTKLHVYWFSYSLIFCFFECPKFRSVESILVFVASDNLVIECDLVSNTTVCYFQITTFCPRRRKTSLEYCFVSSWTLNSIARPDGNIIPDRCVNTARSWIKKMEIRYCLCFTCWNQVVFISPPGSY